MRVCTYSNENGTAITVSDTHFTVRFNGLCDLNPNQWGTIISACKEVFKACELCTAKEAHHDRA